MQGLPSKRIRRATGRLDIQGLPEIPTSLDPRIQMAQRPELDAWRNIQQFNPSPVQHSPTPDAHELPPRYASWQQEVELPALPRPHEMPATSIQYPPNSHPVTTVVNFNTDTDNATHHGLAANNR